MDQNSTPFIRKDFSVAEERTRQSRGNKKTMASLAMLLKTNIEKMSNFFLLAMLMNKKDLFFNFHDVYDNKRVNKKSRCRFWPRCAAEISPIELKHDPHSALKSAKIEGTTLSMGCAAQGVGTEAYGSRREQRACEVRCGGRRPGATVGILARITRN